VLHGAREMVSLLAENQDFHRPGVIDEARHLKLGLNDIAEARPGLTAPGEIHVDRLIRFAQGWDQRARWWFIAGWGFPGHLQLRPSRH
jgi:predicted protein tyrosine phosphatase